MLGLILPVLGDTTISVRGGKLSSHKVPAVSICTVTPGASSMLTSGMIFCLKGSPPVTTYRDLRGSWSSCFSISASDCNLPDSKSVSQNEHWRLHPMRRMKMARRPALGPSPWIVSNISVTARLPSSDSSCLRIGLVPNIRVAVLLVSVGHCVLVCWVCLCPARLIR